MLITALTNNDIIKIEKWYNKNFLKGIISIYKQFDETNPSFILLEKLVFVTDF